MNFLRARDDIIREMVGKMPEQHRRFLISVKRGEPDWGLLHLPGAKDLPAVRWKLENLAKLSADKRAQLLKGLNEALRIKTSQPRARFGSLQLHRAAHVSHTGAVTKSRRAE